MPSGNWRSQEVVVLYMSVCSWEDEEQLNYSTDVLVKQADCYRGMLQQQKAFLPSQNGHWQHMECSIGSHFVHATATVSSAAMPPPVATGPAIASKAAVGVEGAKPGREEEQGRRGGRRDWIEWQWCALDPIPSTHPFLLLRLAPSLRTSIAEQEVYTRLRGNN